MPALPWTTIRTPDPARTYLAYATKLPLAKHRYVPGFLRDTLRIRRQLRSRQASSATRCSPTSRHATFWTVSVWEDEAVAPGVRRCRTASLDHPPPAGPDGRQRPATFDVAGSRCAGAVADVETRLS